MEKMLTTIVKLSKNKYIEKETGYLICENATLGSTGMQEYFAGDLDLPDLAPNVRVKVYRPSEEVFKPESLASLNNKAFTVLHPNEMVNSENDSELRKGSVYNVRREGETIVGDIQITDKDTIEKSRYIKCLSLGYNLDLEKMEDRENSYIARNIRYNHLALVPKGRSKVAQINDSDTDDNFNMEEQYMSLFKRDVEVDDADKMSEKEEKEAKKIDKKEDEIEKEDKKEVEADDSCEEVKDECAKDADKSEEIKDECSAKDEEDKSKEEKDEKRDEKEGAEEDTVTKEIEKRVAKGDYTKKDLEKLLKKLEKGDTKEIKADYKERKEEEKEAKDEEKAEKDDKKEEKNTKKAKDGADMTLEEIANIADADVRKVALDEYKASKMAEKGMLFGDDSKGFVPAKEEAKATAMDAEAERKKYYKNTLNPHKNPNWRKEDVNISDVVVF